MPENTSPAEFLLPAQPSSKFAAFFNVIHQLVSFRPEILDAIAADHLHHALEKKRLRFCDAQAAAAEVEMPGNYIIQESPIPPLPLSIGNMEE